MLYKKKGTSDVPFYTFRHYNGPKTPNPSWGILYTNNPAMIVESTSFAWSGSSPVKVIV